MDVDFILGDMEIALEAKGADRITSDHLKNLREIKQDFPSLKELLIVCLEKNIRKTEDGIWILPVQEFSRVVISSGTISQ